MWVDHMVDHFSTYIYQKRGFYYFSRRIPKQVQHCHARQRIVFALNTRSRAKAVKYAQVICQRLDERWLPMRLDAMGLGNVLANDVMASSAPKLSEALEGYLQLKGMGKPKTFHQAAVRIASVVIDICGDRRCLMLKLIGNSAPAAPTVASQKTLFGFMIMGNAPTAR